MNTLIFTIADKEYAVDIAQVREVIRMREPISIPESAAFVEGVISLRSKVIPLVSLRKLLAIDTSTSLSVTPRASSRIIITQIEGHLIGAVVDKVVEVRRIEQNNITSPDDCLRDCKYLTGVAKVDNRLILIVDMEKFFSPEDKANVKEVHRRVEVRKRP